MTGLLDVSRPVAEVYLAPWLEVYLDKAAALLTLHMHMVQYKYGCSGAYRCHLLMILLAVMISSLLGFPLI